MSETTTDAPVSTEIELTPDLTRLVNAVMDKVALGEVTFAEAVTAALGERVKPPEITPTAFEVSKITDEQRAALVAIVDLYGKVVPTEPRLLSAEELTAIVREREVINTLLAFLATRKDTSIRETLANHLDKVVESQPKADEQPKDQKGHYAVKQSVPVEDTDLHVQRIVSQPKPKVSGASVQAAFRAGELTREEYISLTTKPEVEREFDEVKARNAIKKNPALLFRLAKATTKSNPTTTIKVQ